MRVSVNVLHGNSNAQLLCRAFAQGITAAGDTAVMRTALESNMDSFDAALFWGFVTECQNIKKECEARGIPWFFMDNGYQLRSTHFKVTLNDRHPESYIMHRSMPDTRFKQWGVTIQPWKRDGKYILLAGSSRKASWSFGRSFEEYETWAADKIRDVTDVPIVYRPKPNSFREARQIRYTRLDMTTPFDQLLAGAWAVVNHHSNVGCDALLAGVPVFTRCGAALPLSAHDSLLYSINAPLYPDGREQWAYNLAYCQWSAAEMASGECWRHMRSLYEDQARPPITR